ncbi:MULTISPECIES: ParE family toxin-like protein [Klebsiella]|uniref:ParE family toxin-like protein n=1 Tax=Klebsiella TaxID=570 RepID=UPI003AF28108
MRALLLLQLARRVPLQRQICIVLNKQQLTPQRVHRTLNPYLVHISMAIGMHHRLICKRSAQRQQTWVLVTHESYNRHIGHRRYKGTKS